jgi:hypothetical protein
MEGEKTFGTVKVMRKFVETKLNEGKTDAKMFALHTHIKDTTLEQHATMAIVHGFAECSDVHLEMAI